MFDSGANICVIRDRSLVMANTEIENYTSVLGVKGDACTGINCTMMYFDVPAVYIPSAAANLLSDNIVKNAFLIERVRDDIGHAYLLRRKADGVIFRFCKNKNGLFVWCPLSSTSSPVFEHSLLCAEELFLNPAVTRKTLDKLLLVDKLHRALSYCSKKVLETYAINGALSKYRIECRDIDDYFKYWHDTACTGCMRGKLRAEDASVVVHPAAHECGELIHADVLFIKSEQMVTFGLIYLLTVDEFSGYLSIHKMVDRSYESFLRALSNVKTLYERHSWKMKCIRMDNEKAVVHKLDNLRNSLGCDISLCTPYRHVRTAERYIGYAKSLFRSTVCGLPYKLPLEFYDRCFEFCIQSCNLCYGVRSPTHTPYQLFVQKPVYIDNVMNVRFGEIVRFYAYEMNKATDRPIGGVGIVIGRAECTAESANIFDLEKKTVVVCHDMKPINVDAVIKKRIRDVLGDGKKDLRLHFSDKVFDDLICNSVERCANSSSASDPPVSEESLVVQPVAQTMDGTDSPLTESVRATDVSQGEPTERTSHPIRDTRLTAHDASSLGNCKSVLNSNLFIGRISRRPGLRNSTALLSVEADVEADVEVEVALLSYHEACKEYGSEVTEKALRAELTQMQSKAVWEYVKKCNVPSGEKVIPSTLLFKDKFHADGSFDKLKARLAACGNYAEDKGLETSSPTVNFYTLMAVLTIAAKHKMILGTFDVAGAYLNAPLNVPVFMKLRKEIAAVLVAGDPNLAQFTDQSGQINVKLVKALYGLREASKAWYETLSDTLCNMGLVQAESDICMYTKGTEGNRTVVVVYVDDILVCAHNTELVDEVRTGLTNAFGAITGKVGSDLEFLQMRIEIDIEHNIRVSQNAYLDKVLSAFPDTPECDLPFLNCEDDERMVEVDADDFRSTVMKLMYIAIRTRPDILYPVIILSSHLNEPSSKDSLSLCRIIGYLKKNSKHGLIFLSGPKLNVTLYVDAAFACGDKGRSQTGFVILPDECGSGSVLCRSLVQKVVANSTMEAELIALHEAVLNYRMCISVYEEILQVSLCDCTMYEDNEAVIAILSGKNVGFKGRAKFIDRRYFSVHEHLSSGKLKLTHIGTDNMLADFLTKRLAGHKFTKFRIGIMGQEMGECHDK